MNGVARLRRMDSGEGRPGWSIEATGGAADPVYEAMMNLIPRDHRSRWGAVRWVEMGWEGPVIRSVAAHGCLVVQHMPDGSTVEWQQDSKNGLVRVQQDALGL